MADIPADACDLAKLTKFSYVTLFCKSATTPVPCALVTVSSLLFHYKEKLWNMYNCSLVDIRSDALVLGGGRGRACSASSASLVSSSIHNEQ